MSRSYNILLEEGESEREREITCFFYHTVVCLHSQHSHFGRVVLFSTSISFDNLNYHGLFENCGFTFS